MTELVDTVKMRWRIERDSQELKQESGLSHNEGRGWRGFAALFLSSLLGEERFEGFVKSYIIRGDFGTGHQHASLMG